MVKSISETLPQRFFDMVLMFTDKLQIGDTPRQSIGCTDWTVLGVSWRPGSRKHMGRKTQNPPQKNVQSQHLELITSLLVALTIVPDTVLLLETKIGGKSLETSIQTYQGKLHVVASTNIPSNQASDMNIHELHGIAIQHTPLGRSRLASNKCQHHKKRCEWYVQASLLEQKQ